MPSAPSVVRPWHRAFAGALVLLTAFHLTSLLATTLGPDPNSLTALTDYTTALFPQSWHLFAPDIPRYEAALRVQCSSPQGTTPWLDPEGERIASARAFRWGPSNKLLHSDRALAHTLATALSSYALALCPPHAPPCQAALSSVRDLPGTREAFLSLAHHCARTLPTTTQFSVRLDTLDLASHTTQSVSLGSAVYAP